MEALSPKLVLAARAGDEVAQDTIFKHFDSYIRGWAWKEVNTGRFAGTMIDADDLANMFRERIWLAIRKFKPRRSKDFAMVAKAYMAAGLWATRNKAHRQYAMPKERVHATHQTKRVRNKTTGKLIVKEVKVKGGIVLESSAPIPLHSLRIDGRVVEAERLIAALRVEVDFDFDLYVAELHDALAKRDPFLPMILRMLWQGSGLEEIAKYVGTTAERVQQLVEVEIRPLATQYL